MTRRCAHCKEVLGEKCPRCGSLQLLTILRTGASRRFKCANCHHTFDEGEGGDTHTICAKCSKEELSKALHKPPEAMRHMIFLVHIVQIGNKDTVAVVSPFINVGGHRMTAGMKLFAVLHRITDMELDCQGDASDIVTPRRADYCRRAIHEGAWFAEIVWQDTEEEDRVSSTIACEQCAEAFFKIPTENTPPPLAPAAAEGA